MKIRWSKHGIISADFRYTITDNEKHFRKILKSLDIRGHVSFTINGFDATTHYFKNGRKEVAVVCIKPMQPVHFMGLIVHEAVHIHRRNMEKLAETDPGEEISCYSTQEIVLGMIKIMKNLKITFEDENE